MSKYPFFQIRLGAAIIIISLIIYGEALCGADGKAKELFNKGDYDGAIMRLSEVLPKKNDHQDNIRLMDSCLFWTLSNHRSSADRFAADSEWDKAYDEYKSIWNIAQMLEPLRVFREVKKNGKKNKEQYIFEVDNVDTLLSNVRTKALEYHYETGVRYQDSDRYRDAALEYKKVQKYDHYFKDNENRLAECRKRAMIKIAVLPFESKGTGSGFGEIGQQFAEKAISKAMAKDPIFLEFVDKLNTEDSVHYSIAGSIYITSTYPDAEKSSGQNCVEIMEDTVTKTVCVNWQKFTRTGQVLIDINYKIKDRNGII